MDSYEDLPKKAIIQDSTTILTRKILLMQSPEVLPRHIDELLSVMLWKFTEANGDRNTRFWSQGYCQNKNIKNSRHEHVHTRKSLIQRLKLNPDAVEDILRDAIGCIVTTEEHEFLHHVDPGLMGWDRYRAAGVRVYDRQEKKWLW